MEGVNILPPQPRIFPVRNNIPMLAVIGMGKMGVGVVAELLRRGCRVKMYDSDLGVLHGALTALMSKLNEQVDQGLLLKGDVEELISRASLVGSLGDAIDSVSLVFEVVSERIEAKRNAIRAAVQACEERGTDPSQLVYCTNTASIPLEALTEGLPLDWVSRIIGARFFYPCLFVDDVELSATMATIKRTQTNRWKVWQNLPPAMHEADRTLRNFGFRTCRYVPAQNIERRLLTTEEMMLYSERQKWQCMHDAAVLEGNVAMERSHSATTADPVC